MHRFGSTRPLPAATAPTHAAPDAPHRRPRPAFTVSLGRFLMGEVWGASAFLRTGRMETYARRRAAHDPRWAFICEPGSLEVCGLGLALTVSRAPVSASAGEQA